MTNKIIVAEGLSKRYLLGNFGISTFRDELAALSHRLAAAAKRKHEKGASPTNKREFWAIKDLSFEIEQGDTVGLIGRNGAGKSTLLKVLSRITRPSEGKFALHGKAAALLEVGTGFHPDLTGLENVYLNGAILGMKRWEIRSRVDSIFDFSGVARFADTPVKRYSSGMRVRLAFSVAAHLRQDILIVDEVLAVGDNEFQKKCLGKMGEVADQGRTVVFVSHNMNAISRLCRTCMYLKDGKLVSFGKTNEIVDKYLGDAGGYDGQVSWKEGISADGVSEFKLYSIAFKNPKGEVKSCFSITDDICVSVRFEVFKPIYNIGARIQIRSNDGVELLTSKNDNDPHTKKEIPEGIYEYTVTIPKKKLNFGSYSLSFVAAETKTKFLIKLDDILNFEVAMPHEANETEGLVEYPGFIYPDLKWAYSRD